MEVSYAPDMYIRSDYYGADEFFEIQGTSGFIWVTRYTGKMLDLPPLMLYNSDGQTTGFAHVDADWANSFKASSSHFIDSLIAGAQPDMTGDLAIKVLQLCFAVYQASNTSAPAVPADIETSVSPPWWPPLQGEWMKGLVPE